MDLHNDSEFDRAAVPDDGQDVEVVDNGLDGPSENLTEVEADPERGASVTDFDDVFVDALAVGRSHAYAGALVNRSAKTVQRRMADPLFAARVLDRRHELMADATGQLTGLASRAVETIADAMGSERVPDRLRAAQLALLLALKFRADTEYETRLREIESTLAAVVDAGEVK